MAKKAKGKKTYEPMALLEVDASSNDVAIGIKHAKVMANMPHGGTSYRDNIAYRGSNFDKYGALINDFVTPKMAISLSQVVYNRFGLVRHALDTMSEFTVNGVNFVSQKKQPRQIMQGWAEGIGLKGFLDQVALEYYRSGNVYIYRFESNIKDSALRDLSSVFGFKISGGTKIATKYTIINPTLINFITGSLFNNPVYQIVIPASEVQLTLQHFKDNPAAIGELPKEFAQGIQDYLGGGSRRKTGDLIIKLNPDNIIVLYRKKQPYESYAMPFLAGTFDDLEFRQELRNMDKALARVVAKILIHVAVGDDEHIPSPQALDSIRQKLANPSTSTYLITDGTVKINEYYPNISEMLDPKKYDAVKADIQTALGISTAAYGDGNGSFSNNFLGIKILVERIIDGRSKILQDFLIPEVERVAKALRIKTPVKPEIVGADLNDKQEWAKIYTRLYEDGVLSPQSIIESIRDEKFPTYDEELERQQETKDLKDKGYFEPSANRGGDSQSSGRPDGTPNSTSQKKAKKTAPNGSNAVLLRGYSQEEYDLAYGEALSFVKRKVGAKRLNQDQKGVLDNVCKEYLLTAAYDVDSFNDFLNKFFNKS